MPYAMKTVRMAILAGTVILVCALAAMLALAATASAQRTDCVTGLSYCAQRCDLKVKPESGQRPACANTCIANYQQCVRAAAIREGTTGPLGTPGFTILPPGND